MEKDEQKQEHFLDGLNDGIQYMLTAHTFDKAIVVESKRRKLKEKKRKFNPLALDKQQSPLLHLPAGISIPPCLPNHPTTTTNPAAAVPAATTL